MSQLKKSPKKKSKSVLKRERQSKKRSIANKANKSKMRTFIKKFRQLLQNKSLEEAKKMVPKLEKEIDMTVKKGVIHWKTGARYKSRLLGHLANLTKQAAQTQSSNNQ
ncbi:MAG: 30S ribosomal protein S20 [Thermoanaerobaculia bacterium]